MSVTNQSERAVSPAMAVVLLVAIGVVLSVAAGAYLFVFADDFSGPGNSASVGLTKTADGNVSVQLVSQRESGRLLVRCGATEVQLTEIGDIETFSTSSCDTIEVLSESENGDRTLVRTESVSDIPNAPVRTPTPTPVTTTPTPTPTPTANSPPDASFSPTSGTYGVSESITFDASTTFDRDGNIATYEWEFDDGRTATGEVAPHSYNSTGSYDVTLTVTDTDGAVDTITHTLTITTTPPVVSFTPDDGSTFYRGEIITFDASKSSDWDGTITEYNWDFDSDGSTDATGRILTHDYQTAGVYDATLTVIDDDGNSISKTHALTIQRTAPTASFTPGNGATFMRGTTVMFDASNSNDLDGTIEEYQWDFESDGTVDATGETTSHAYSVTGAVDVTLTVIDDNGETGTVTHTYNILNNPPVAAFDPADGSRFEQNSVVNFDASASDDSDGTITQYEWDFNDDGVIDATGVSPSWTYAGAGSYGVTLTVTDDNGDTDSEIHGININSLPYVSFTPSSGANFDRDETITFDGSASGDSDGTIEEYRWDFGNDGTIDATGPTTTRSYSTLGSYDITLTVVDNNGATQSATHTINIRNNPPVAEFSPADGSRYAQGDGIDFDATASNDPDGTIVEYRWDFDSDGTTDSTEPTLTYAFINSGTFDVTLTVVDNDGRSSSVTHTLEITDNTGPTATFTPPSGTNVKVNTVVTFDASASSDPEDNPLTYRWDFDGDGTVDETTNNPQTTYTYTQTQSVDVTLTVDDGFANYDSVTHTLNVYGDPPIASFTPTSGSYTVGDTQTFDGRGSSDPEGELTNYRWTVDGNFVSSSSTYTHTFSNSGTRTVRLQVTDAEGKTDTFARQFSVQANAYTIDFETYNTGTGGLYGEGWRDDTWADYAIRTGGADGTDQYLSHYTNNNPLTIYKNIPQRQYSSISFYVKLGERVNNEVTLRDSGGTEIGTIFHNDAKSGIYWSRDRSTSSYETRGSGNFLSNPGPYTWTHVELKDINYGSNRLDIYINGFRVKNDIAFKNNVNNIARVELSSNSGFEQSNGGFDEFKAEE